MPPGMKLKTPACELNPDVGKAARTENVNNFAMQDANNV